MQPPSSSFFSPLLPAPSSTASRRHLLLSSVPAQSNVSNTLYQLLHTTTELLNHPFFMPTTSSPPSCHQPLSPSSLSSASIFTSFTPPQSFSFFSPMPSPPSLSSHRCHRLSCRRRQQAKSSPLPPSHRHFFLHSPSVSTAELPHATTAPLLHRHNSSDRALHSHLVSPPPDPSPTTSSSHPALSSSFPSLSLSSLHAATASASPASSHRRSTFLTHQ